MKKIKPQDIKTLDEFVYMYQLTIAKVQAVADFLNRDDGSKLKDLKHYTNAARIYNNVTRGNVQFEFVSLKDVCIILGISRSTVYNLHQKGKLKFYTLSGLRRIFIKVSEFNNCFEDYNEG